MKTRRLLLAMTGVAIAAVMGLLIAPSSPAIGKGKPPEDDPPAPYVVMDLGGFAGGEFVQSDALRMSNPDDLGLLTIVGDSRAANGDFQAAVWTADPDLGIISVSNLTSTSHQGGAVDTNDAGWVVGWSTEIGFVSIPGQPLIELPALSAADGRVSWPTAINNRGQIVGNGLVDVGVVVDGELVIVTEGHGLLWQVDENGVIDGPIDLGLFFPNDINEFGMMAGQVEDPSSAAALAAIDPLGDVQVTVLTTAHSRATAMNDVGQVVGWMRPAPGEHPQAFLWEPGIGPQLLGLLPDKKDSAAYGINNLGEVVGQSVGGNTGKLPIGSGFLWRDGVMFDLNELHDTQRQFHIANADDINDAGQIAVGIKVLGKGRDGEVHAGLFLPIQTSD